MFSFEIDDGFDVVPTENDAGQTTLEFLNNYEVTENLVALRLITPKATRLALQPEGAIDWFTLRMDYKLLLPIIGTKIDSIISDTFGVLSVDLSESTYNLNNGVLAINNICYEVDGASLRIDI